MDWEVVPGFGLIFRAHFIEPNLGTHCTCLFFGYGFGIVFQPQNLVQFPHDPQDRFRNRVELSFIVRTLTIHDTEHIQNPIAIVI